MNNVMIEEIPTLIFLPWNRTHNRFWRLLKRQEKLVKIGFKEQQMPWGNLHGYLRMPRTLTLRM